MGFPKEVQPLNPFVSRPLWADKALPLALVGDTPSLLVGGKWQIIRINILSLSIL